MDQIKLKNLEITLLDKISSLRIHNSNYHKSFYGNMYDKQLNYPIKQLKSPQDDKQLNYPIEQLKLPQEDIKFNFNINHVTYNFCSMFNDIKNELLYQLKMNYKMQEENSRENLAIQNIKLQKIISNLKEKNQELSDIKEKYNILKINLNVLKDILNNYKKLSTNLQNKVIELEKKNMENINLIIKQQTQLNNTKTNEIKSESKYNIVEAFVNKKKIEKEQKKIWQFENDYGSYTNYNDEDNKILNDDYNSKSHCQHDMLSIYINNTNYVINFNQLTQKNTLTKKIRKIRNIMDEYYHEIETDPIMENLCIRDF